MRSRAAVRHVGTVKTPLLAPSYSSRGFVPLAELHRNLKDHTSRVSLVSAYDIHHDQLPIESLYESDVTLLDSGGYEAYASSELSIPAPWRLNDYREVLKQVRDFATIVPVTFDFGAPRDIAEQVREALALADDFPQLAWDFLIKPSRQGGLVEVDAVTAQMSNLSRFAVIGVTQDELGPSALARCHALFHLRAAMDAAGLRQPIHVFGCLDPAMIPYFVLAGADIFDGLQWLRSTFRPEGQIRMSSAIIRDGRMAVNEADARLAYRMANVQALQRLEEELQKWIQEPSRSGSLDLQTASQFWEKEGPDVGE